MPHKRKDLNITGSNLWYLVGLITSDGCLSSDGRHIDITSKDYELLEKIKMATGITNKIGSKYG
ncbi:MAG: LAGLIDADG family homing endonuclease, partial [Candidatus Omnitrophica bacterium]|nr:LAGLIDADG family homing endonuclease [Candidatus Omnitrophota bacterium]